MGLRSNVRMVGVLAVGCSAWWVGVGCGGEETHETVISGGCGQGTTMNDAGLCVPLSPGDAGIGGTGGNATGGTGGGAAGNGAVGGTGGTTATGGTGGDPDDAGLDAPEDAATDVASDTSDDVDSDASGACSGGCDDGVDCTVDSCSNGQCVHWPGPASSCPTGQVCDPQQGCVIGPVCSDTAQCQQLFSTDPCKVNIACELATKTCTYDLLDGDGDDHPPIVCGGDDCRDDDSSIHPGQEETCGVEDINCDGSADDGAVCPYWMRECVDHVCVCKPEFVCPGISYCVDTQTSISDCGACGNGCEGEDVQCVNGQCVCPLLCDGFCVDPDTDRSNCGACGNECGYGEGVTCVGGQCVCRTGMLTCGGTCVDPLQDFSHCGGCGQSCSIGQICQQGQCVAVTGGVTELVYVPRSDGAGDFGIDRTEVTRAQYAAWVAMQPPTHDQPLACLSNTIEVPDPNSSCMEEYIVFHGWNEEQHPQVCVEWCDAWMYCWSVGKKLCGHQDGGPEMPLIDLGNSWYDACSSGGLHKLTYGDAFLEDPCNANVLNTWNAQDAVVASFPECHSPESEYQGVFDLSGNVGEWVNAVGATNHEAYVFRDGDSRSAVSCDQAHGVHLGKAQPGVGFRCCSL